MSAEGSTANGDGGAPMSAAAGSVVPGCWGALAHLDDHQTCGVSDPVEVSLLLLIDIAPIHTSQTVITCFT